MPKYTTKYVKNLSTGEPIILEVNDDVLKRLERGKRIVLSGQVPMSGGIEGLVKTCEFSFFASYEKVLQIWTEDGFTTELITQILIDFGVPRSFIPKLLEDDDYIANIRPWFAGITCDGERATRTLAVVYDSTKKYFSATESIAKGIF